jgi:hypothetical protein
MYNIHPNKNSAKKARLAQAERVKRSIAYLVKECATKLNLKDNKVNSIYSALQKMNHLSPEIHYLHHALQTAMRRQDSESSNEYLSRLKKIVHSPISASPVISISSLGHSEWEKFVVTEVIKITKEECGLSAEIKPVLEPDFEFAKNRVEKAQRLIEKHDPDMFYEIQEQVKLIKLFSGKITMGLTDVRILGAMLIRLPRHNVNSILYFFEHIIHEASHIHLNCLMAIDPLVLNSADEKFSSPLRKDPRPMIGVYHATYVSARTARSFMRLYQATGNKELLHPLAETLDETLRGILVIDRHAKLTINGKKLVDSIKELLFSARTFPEWKEYNFSKQQLHRFGAGKSTVSQLQSAVR